MITLYESGLSTFGQGDGRLECEMPTGLPHDFHEFSTLLSVKDIHVLLIRVSAQCIIVLTAIYKTIPLLIFWDLSCSFRTSFHQCVVLRLSDMQIWGLFLLDDSSFANGIIIIIPLECSHRRNISHIRTLS